MKIVTGYGGEPHITAADDQALHLATVGGGNIVFDVRNKFAATVVNNNQVRIADGEGMIQGVHFRIDTGTYDYVDIENGASGKNRKDLIVARYTKDSGTGVESVALAVIKGTAATGTASEPSYNTGTIATGSLIVDFPLYVVNISELTISSVTAKYGAAVKSIKDMTVPEKITLSAKTNVTAARSIAYKVGRLVMFSIAFSTGATLSSTDNLFSGFPAPAENWDIVGTVAGATKDFIVHTSGNLRFNGSTSASSNCFVSGVYVAAS